MAFVDGQDVYRFIFCTKQPVIRGFQGEDDTHCSALLDGMKAYSMYSRDISTRFDVTVMNSSLGVVTIWEEPTS